MRKDSFAVTGIYGEEPVLEFEGVWLFKGDDLHKDFKEHSSFEWVEMKKLNMNKKEDKKVLYDFWTQRLLTKKEMRVALSMEESLRLSTIIAK